MAGEPDHNIVLLADSIGEFGRYVPFGTYVVRTIVGGEELIASGWHWTWEYQGAPAIQSTLP